MDFTVGDNVCVETGIDTFASMGPARFDQVGFSIRVDVVERLCCSEGEFIGSEANDVAMFFMQKL